MHVAESVVDFRVAPMLAAKERKYDDSLQAMKNECDQLLAEAVVEVDMADASFREIRLQLAEMIDTDEETPIPDLLEKVGAELDLRWATRQQYAEERDEAQAAIRDIDAHATPIGLLHEDDPEGSPHHYLVTVGALHRALGKSNGTGVQCDRERDILRWLHAEAVHERDVLTADAMQLDVEMAQLRRDLERAVATREQATAERDKAREYVARLVLAATKSWPGWGDEVPAAFTDADQQIAALHADVERLNNAPIGWLYSEIDRLRAELRHVREYTDTTRYHQQQHTDAVRKLEKVRGQLVAILRDHPGGGLVNEPAGWMDTLAVVRAHLDNRKRDREFRTALIQTVSRWLPAGEPVEDWQMLQLVDRLSKRAAEVDGQPDTEATEQPADEYWCGTCKEAFSPLDHYHCVKCKALTGMTGHPNGCPTPYGPTPMVPRVWRKGDAEPVDVAQVRDVDGDIWERRVADGDLRVWMCSLDDPSWVWRILVERYGPLTVVTGDGES
jgi:uncharacterized small protein (DUF1192 family)